jgi:hypothetical protein
MTDTALDTSVVETTPILADTETTTAPETSSDWKAQIPEEYRGQFENYKDLAAAAKAHVELRRMTSKKLTDLTPEEAKILSGRAGIPESPDKYDLTGSEEAIDPITAKWFTNTAYKAGIPQEAAKTLATEFVAFQQEQQRQQLTNLEELKKSEVNILREAWGPVYDERSKLVEEGIDKLGIPELRKTLEETNMIHSSSLRKAFAEVGRILSEDRGPETKNTTYALSTEEARTDLEKFRIDYKAELNTATHPQHNWAVQELERRLLRAHGQ